MIRAIVPEFRSFCRRMIDHFGPDVEIRKTIISNVAMQIRINPENVDEKKMKEVIVDAADFVTRHMVPVQIDHEAQRVIVKPKPSNIAANVTMDFDKLNLDSSKPIPNFKEELERRERRMNRKNIKEVSLGGGEPNTTCCSQKHD